MYTYKSATTQTYKQISNNISYRYGNLRIKELNRMTFPFFDAPKDDLNRTITYKEFNSEISVSDYVTINDNNESFFKCKIAIQSVRIDPKILSNSYIYIEPLTHYTNIEKEFDMFPYNPLLFDDITNAKCIRIALNFELKSLSNASQKVFEEAQDTILALIHKMGVRYNSVNDIYISQYNHKNVR